MTTWQSITKDRPTYYKLQVYNPTTMAWLDIQKRYANKADVVELHANKFADKQGRVVTLDTNTNKRTFDLI